MIRKKGDANINQLLSIIIAVLGLALITYGIYSLYRAGVDSESTNAKNVLEKVVNKINALNDGDASTTLVQGFKGSEKWYLIGWGKEDYTRPDKCFLNSCICICQFQSEEPLNNDIRNIYRTSLIDLPLAKRDRGTRIADFMRYRADNCQKAGFCRALTNIEDINVAMGVDSQYQFTSAISLGKEFFSYPFIQFFGTRPLIELSFYKAKKNIFVNRTIIPDELDKTDYSDFIFNT